jgi:hypothetical protein
VESARTIFEPFELLRAHASASFGNSKVKSKLALCLLEDIDHQQRGEVFEPGEDFKGKHPEQQEPELVGSVHVRHLVHIE